MEHLQRDDIWLTMYTVMRVILHGGKTFFILMSNQSIKMAKSSVASAVYQLDFEKMSAIISSVMISFCFYSYIVRISLTSKFTKIGKFHSLFPFFFLGKSFCNANVK